MEITHQVLDIAKYEERQFRPATIIDRKPAERWLVRDRPIGVNEKPTIDWGWVMRGEHVRIPLFPYLANGNNPAVALAYAAQLAFQAMSAISSKVEVQRVHIVVGDPVQETDIPDGPPVLRFWMGFGFSIKDLK